MASAQGLLRFLVAEQSCQAMVMILAGVGIAQRGKVNKLAEVSADLGQGVAPQVSGCLTLQTPGWDWIHGAGGCLPKILLYRPVNAWHKPRRGAGRGNQCKIEDGR